LIVRNIAAAMPTPKRTLDLDLRQHPDHKLSVISQELANVSRRFLFEFR
jgi:hypothetical protein